MDDDPRFELNALGRLSHWAFHPLSVLAVYGIAQYWFDLLPAPGVWAVIGLAVGLLLLGAAHPAQDCLRCALPNRAERLAVRCAESRALYWFRNLLMTAVALAIATAWMLPELGAELVVVTDTVTRWSVTVALALAGAYMLVAPYEYRLEDADHAPAPTEESLRR